MRLYFLRPFQPLTFTWVITSDSKVYRANMGPTWVLSAPDGPHVCPMKLAIMGTESQIKKLECVSSSSFKLRNHWSFAFPVLCEQMRSICCWWVDSIQKAFPWHYIIMYRRAASDIIDSQWGSVVPREFKFVTNKLQNWSNCYWLGKCSSKFPDLAWHHGKVPTEKSIDWKFGRHFTLLMLKFGIDFMKVWWKLCFLWPKSFMTGTPSFVRPTIYTSYRQGVQNSTQNSLSVHKRHEFVTKLK